MKVENIPTKRLYKCNLEDPRPNKYRHLEGYNDLVRNSIVNYCARTGQDLAMRYIYPKADLQTAVQDHFYLKRNFTEYWVDEGVKVLFSYRIVNAILEKTVSCWH